MPAYRLSQPATADILDILVWTAMHFGDSARRRYQVLITTALLDIETDPLLPGSRSRLELGPGIRSFHLEHSRRRAMSPDGIVQRPRHLILYRFLDPAVIGIGRILHDAMDIERHLPKQFGDELL
jgi:toxin ParE1/3/4